MPKTTIFLVLMLILSAKSQTVYFNEIRSNDASTDDGEFFELIGPAGFDLSDWQVVHYNGTGGSTVFTHTFPPGTVFPDDNITDISGQKIGFIIVKRTGHIVPNFDFEWGTSSLQNGPDGLLLKDDQGRRIQALTWNGSGDLTGGDPPWRNIGSDQNSDNSLSSPDSSYESYQKSWEYVAPTPGFLNVNQTNGDISLPVELSSFRVVGFDGRVELIWTTEAELDNQGFIIERSFHHDHEFIQIASYESVEALIGSGNSSVKRTYHFTDTSVFNGLTYWYRLIDVSVNGVHTFHLPVSVSPLSPVDGIEPIPLNNEEAKPETFNLYQNYPNPFNPGTKIKFYLPESGQGRIRINLNVFDIQGQKIKILFDGFVASGTHEFSWDGKNGMGNKVAGGIYLYVLETTDFIYSKKMVLLR